MFFSPCYLLGFVAIYTPRPTLSDLSFAMSASITIESPRLPIPVFSKPKPFREYDSRGPGIPLGTYDSASRTAMTGNSASGTRSLELQSLPESRHSESPSSGSAEQMQTIWEPFKNRFRVLAACLTAFANGMNDSANGALIESMERQVLSLYGWLLLTTWQLLQHQLWHCCNDLPLQCSWLCCRRVLRKHVVTKAWKSEDIGCIRSILDTRLHHHHYDPSLRRRYFLVCCPVP